MPTLARPGMRRKRCGSNSAHTDRISDAPSLEESYAWNVRGSKCDGSDCICRMSAELPQGQYGPGIGYREYSLLDNPRFHAAHVRPGGNPKLSPPRLAPAIVQVCEVRAGRMMATLCMALLGQPFLGLAIRGVHV